MAFGAITLNVSSVKISHGFVSASSYEEGSAGLNLGLVESQHQQSPSTLHGHVHDVPDFRQTLQSSSEIDWMVVSPMHLRFPPCIFYVAIKSMCK